MYKRNLSRNNSSKRIKLTISPLGSESKTQSSFSPPLINNESEIEASNPKPSAASFFVRVLQENGIIFGTGNDVHKSKLESTAIIQKLKKYFDTDVVNYPQNVVNFVHSFKKYITDRNCFEKLTMGTILLPKEDTSHKEHVQMSILKMILRIDFMQTKIINILLDELTNFVIQDSLKIEMVYVRSILGHLRYLDFVDGEEFTTRFLDIIEIATPCAQHEMICSLPEIIPETHRDSAALILSRFLIDHSAHTAAILESLSCLCTGKNVKPQVNTKVLDLIKSIATIDKMPMLTRFLLSQCDADNAYDLIERLRICLDWGPLDSVTDTPERSTSQVLTYDIINEMLAFPTYRFEAWMKTITSVQSHKEHRPIDLLILFFMHTAFLYAPKQKRYIETVIRKRIVTEMFKVSLIENTFKDFYAVIREHFGKFHKLFELLICDKKPEVAIFGALCYKFFIIYENQSKHYKTIALMNLVNHTQFPGERGNSAMLVLEELSICRGQVLHDNAVALMGLLNLFDNLSLSQTRLAMDIICNVAYPKPPRCPAMILQDETKMILSKNLISHNILIQKKSIVGSITAIKHIATLTSNTPEAHNSTYDSGSMISSISDLSEGGQKEAATLIESIFMKTRRQPELQGMCYDELSALILIHGDTIGKQLINWLCEAVTNDFTCSYNTERIQDEIDGCQLEHKYCINPLDSQAQSTIINIASLVLKPSHDICNIILLCPLFQLLRILHSIKFGGDLETIDAVLGCGLALPVVGHDGSLEDFPFEQRKLVLDCFFYSINWFREVISAFVKQPDEAMKSRVLSRLKLVVQLENEFFKLLNESGIEYRAPVCNFYEEQVCDITKTKKKVIAQSKNKTVDVKGANTINTTAGATQPAGKKVITKSTKDSNVLFRTLGYDVILLLNTNLSIDEEENSITMTEMAYLLQDVVLKLRLLKESKAFGYSPLFSHIKPVNLINQIISMLPNLMKHLGKVKVILTEALEECDNIRDAHMMYFDKTMQAKTCLMLILDLFSEVIDWSVSHSTTNSKLLTDILGEITINENNPCVVRSLAISTVNVICELKPIIITLPMAVNFAKVLWLLIKLIDDHEYSSKFTTICRELLTTEWYNELGLPEKGAQCNIHLELLLKYYFYKSDLKTLIQVVNQLSEEASTLKRKADNLQTYPSFNKANFPLLFRCVFSTFVKAVEEHIQKPLSKLQYLRFWEGIMNTLCKLKAIVKEQETKMNLSTYLKQSHIVLKLFLKHGISGLEVSLRSNTEEVIAILKTMQQSTRFINSICVHAKTKRDVGLLAHVPKMLKLLESIIYSVKAALVANNCSTAFEMGNLLNRNLHGDIITTQSSIETEPNSEDELPQEDSESEIESDLDQESTKSISKLY